MARSPSRTCRRHRRRPASSRASTRASRPTPLRRVTSRPGQLVLREAFGPATSQTGVLAIPRGKIAITVTLDGAADVAGFVGPQSQVTIFVTAPLKQLAGSKKQPTTGNELTVTRTVVTRAEVIATSQAQPKDVSRADGRPGCGCAGVRRLGAADHRAHAGRRRAGHQLFEGRHPDPRPPVGQLGRHAGRRLRQRRRVPPDADLGEVP